MATDRTRRGPDALRRWADSVRVRTTLGAVLVVSLMTCLGAALLVVVLRDLLTGELEASGTTRAKEISERVSADPGRQVLVVGDSEDDIAQLVGPDGRVVAASRNLTGKPALVWPIPDDPVDIANPVDDGVLLVVATRVAADRRLTVLVARSVDARDDAVGFVVRLLTVGLPILVIAVAILSWMLVGRALRPVDEVRREVDEISSRALHRRVSEPLGADEIARLVRTMNNMLDRLETAQERQRRLAADASHELRSPVAAIRQMAEVALAHPTGTTVEELARGVLDEDLRVQQLVEDLLLLARVDEHRLRLRSSAVDLDDLVFEEAQRLRSSTALRVDTSRVSAGRVLGDANGLRRVLRNLGDNAARHARSRITFSLAETERGVILVVDDDGPGIPVSERERVLERFIRLDDARARDAGGSGLGLAIVAELVHAHGGEVDVEQAPDRGARLRLTFPPTPADVPLPAARP